MPVTLRVECVGNFYLASEYWDCDCHAANIHKKSDRLDCSLCVGSEEYCPDSRLIEVMALFPEHTEFVFVENTTGEIIPNSTIRDSIALYLLSLRPDPNAKLEG